MTALRVRLWFWELIIRLSYFSQVFFYKIKNFFFFCGWTSTWSRTHICMTLPFLTAHFSWSLPFLRSQKVVTLPLFPPPSPPANFWQVPNVYQGVRIKRVSEKRVSTVQPNCLKNFRLYKTMVEMTLLLWQPQVRRQLDLKWHSAHNLLPLEYFLVSIKKIAKTYCLLST